RPKGALNHHRGLSNLLHDLQRIYGLTQADSTLQTTAFSFDVATAEMLWPLLCGAKLVLIRPNGQRDSAYLVTLLNQHEITTLHVVPTLLQLLLEERGFMDLGALRRVLAAGEALSLHLQQRFLRHPTATLYNWYGPTETAIYVTSWSCQNDNPPGIVPIGRPVANTQAYILDLHQQPTPVGVAGELHIGGVQVGYGYLNRPELTAEKFIPNPFGPGRLYKTGDLARWLPDGNIEYLGRIDHQVKIRGFRIELGEIEALLGSHPAVQACVVVAREEVPGDKRLVAYLVEAAPGMLPADPRERVAALRSHLQRRLPDYMVPGTFVWLDALPLTPNGKVDRRRLPAPSQQEIQSVARPRSQEEQQLTVLWEKLLGIYPIGIFDNFFELGGHSLLAIRLMGEMRQHFGQELPLQVLFTHPTVAELAELLQKGGELWSFNPIVAIQPRGHRPALYCCPGAGGHTLYLHALARALGDDQPFYGLEAAGLDGKSLPHTTVEAAAAAHVWELRRHQPVGPYYLAGHSFGAQIAFEMARQLHAMGETLGALIVLDGGAPGREPIEMDEVEAILLYESLMLQEVGGRPELTAEELRPLSSEERLQLFKQSAVKAGLMPAGASTDFLRALIAEAIANHRVEYSPARLEAAPIHLIAATERAGTDESELAANWSEYGTVICYETPGEHLTMLHPPNVQRLAETIRTILQKASEREADRDL
ncbi:MAG: AMP-binding protein, partial [Caldilinea sp.]